MREMLLALCHLGRAYEEHASSPVRVPPAGMHPPHVDEVHFRGLQLEPYYSNEHSPYTQVLGYQQIQQGLFSFIGLDYFFPPFFAAERLKGRRLAQI